MRCKRTSSCQVPLYVHSFKAPLLLVWNISIFYHHFVWNRVARVSLVWNRVRFPGSQWHTPYWWEWLWHYLHEGIARSRFVIVWLSSAVGPSDIHVFILKMKFMSRFQVTSSEIHARSRARLTNFTHHSDVSSRDLAGHEKCFEVYERLKFQATKRRVPEALEIDSWCKILNTFTILSKLYYSFCTNGIIHAEIILAPLQYLVCCFLVFVIEAP